MKITITGASGLIGRRLMKLLAGQNHSLHVLSRHAGTNLPAGVKLSSWLPHQGEPPAEAVREADAVIHLAGEPVAQRWSTEVKQRIRDSRVVGTRNLVQALAKLPHRPGILICGSAVGYYGSRGDETLVESSAPGSGYLADVCVEWENEAMAAEPLGIRVVRLRTGVVLDPRGGALQRMLPPFRMAVGGKLAAGKQWMAWIHAQDLVGIIQYALDHPLRGPVNGVAPYPVVNADFAKTMAAAVHRPAIFPVPGFALHLLFGEMAGMLLASQRVIPKEAEAAGFRFRFPQLTQALADLLK